MKRFLALLTAVLMILSLASCGEKKKEEKEETKKETYKAEDIALSTEHFSFTRAEVSYMFHKNYSDFRYGYPDSVDMYNIDTESTLKDQIYYDDVSWFDYFMKATTEQLEQILAFCEGAYAEGIELDDDDKKDIDETIDTWVKYADDYAYTIEELLGKYFNSEVTTDVMRSYLEKETLSMKYQAKLVSEYNFTDEDLENYVSDNADLFYRISYVKVTVDEDDTATPKADAEKIAGAKTVEEFKTLATEYMQKIEMKSDEIEAFFEDWETKGELKQSYGEYTDWAFGGAKTGETFVEADEVDGEYTVYYLTEAAHRDETLSKNIRIIKEDVLTSSSQTVIKDLNDILDTWKKDGATEEKFIELVYANSTDENTVSDGGLVENITQYDEDIPDTVSDWLFGETTRAVGDTAVLKGDDCYYAVYFKGDSISAWKALANAYKCEENLVEALKNLKEKQPITKNEKVINSVDG